MLIPGQNHVVRTVSNDVFELTYLSAGTDGWNDEVWVTWDTHDEQLVWDDAGNCLGEPDQNIELVIS